MLPPVFFCFKCYDAASKCKFQVLMTGSTCTIPAKE